MVVHEQRRHSPVDGLVVVEGLEPLEGAPSEVDALGRIAAIGGDGVVDLFPLALAHVADPEIARRGIERESPRVAQPVRPDRRVGGWVADERIVGRHGEWRTIDGSDRIDAQDLAETAQEIEGVTFRVAAGATVTEADVQQLVGPEGELPAVVVAVGLIHGEDLAETVTVEDAGGGVDGDLGHHGVAVGVDVVHVGEVSGRVECQPQQPLLAVGIGEIGDVEHHVGRQIGDGDHPSGLFHDIELSKARACSDLDGLIERADLEQRHRRFGQWPGRCFGGARCSRLGTDRGRGGGGRLGVNRKTRRRRGDGVHCRPAAERLVGGAVAIGTACGEHERGGDGDGGDEARSFHLPISIACVAVQLVRRVSPSCTTLTTNRPSAVKMVPWAMPRADDVDTADWAYSSHSSARNGRWNHMA